jgi:hypothetical protein
MGTVESGESRPTDQSYAVFEYLSGLLQAEMERLHEIFLGDLVSFNGQLEAMGLDPVEVMGHR